MSIEYHFTSKDALVNFLKEEYEYEKKDVDNLLSEYHDSFGTDGDMTTELSLSWRMFKDETDYWLTETNY